MARSLFVLIHDPDSLTWFARSFSRLARRRCFSAKLARSSGVLFSLADPLFVRADLDHWQNQDTLIFAYVKPRIGMIRVGDDYLPFGAVVVDVGD